MGNRRKTVSARTAQSYRNAQGRMMEQLRRIPRRRRDGEWLRTAELNYPYGPMEKHPSTGVLTLQKQRERTRRDYSAPDLSAMNREALRALAKERGVKGYGHMTTARLREVLA